MNLNFDRITISGKIAVGTSTLAKNLHQVLGWKYVNAGAIQREYDRIHGIHENQQGAASRPDDHEKEIDEMTKTMLRTEKNLVYEAWLSGFMAQGIPHVYKILVICSEDAIRVDRIVNRDNVTVDEAKQYLKQRETENITKWQTLYGNHNFWDPKYFDLVIDTYVTGPMETLGIALDKIGYRGNMKS